MTKLFFLTLLGVMTVGCQETAEKRKETLADALRRGGFLSGCSSRAGAIKDRVFLAGGDSDGNVELGSDGLARDLAPDDPNAGRIDIVSLLRTSKSGNERVLPLWDYASLPLPRALMAIVGSEDFVYLAGGQVSIRDNFSGGYDYTKNLVKDVDVFTREGLWVQGFELSEARAEVQGLFHAGKLYFLGGFNGKKHPEYGSLCVGSKCYYRSDVLDIYDEASGSLETVTMPADAIRPGVFVWQEQLWVLPSQSNFVDISRAASQQEIWIMDLATRTWTVSYLDRRPLGGYVKIESLLYFSNSATGHLEVYDLEEQVWSDFELPQPLTASMCVLGDKLVTLFGSTVSQVMNGQAEAYPYMLIYDFKKGTWRKTRHPNPRTKMTTLCVDNRFYLSAGGINSIGSTVANVDVYDITDETWYENYGRIQDTATEDF